MIHVTVCGKVEGQTLEYLFESKKDLAKFVAYFSDHVCAPLNIVEREIPVWGDNYPPKRFFKAAVDRELKVVYIRRMSTWTVLPTLSMEHGKYMTAMGVSETDAVELARQGMTEHLERRSTWQKR